MSEFRAPTVRMSFASPGKTIFFQGPMPLLPAELTRTMPFCASIDAEREKLGRTADRIKDATARAMLKEQMRLEAMNASELLVVGRIQTLEWS